ncbi:TetR/AcrR family transcriptional regulator [Azomonas macrocytogenes]|uniref:AcrR family transcriptional regulator n=1 Tax=Azomonas macrocytogenes TaxID=69962 RepID=A0A839TAQ6_AZOMA|nr:CerR family C-terminal domain-containing protein [Azomonas macrocytogenes]MBB3105224.1 AcrR family transcriptional regulator [Azomonas macrocytogenes]
MGKPRRIPRTDGEATRARILAAAGWLFAERGYAGAASKAICERAGTDLAAINYHFGSRDGLYRAVLLEGHKHFVNLDMLSELARSDLAPRAKLAVFIDRMVEKVLDDQGWYNRVCAREILAPSPHFASLISEEVMPKFNLLAGIISEVTGIPAGDPALSRCAINIMAPCLMLLVFDRNTPGPFQTLFSQPAEELATHLKGFALAGLEAVSAMDKPHAGPGN